LDLLVRLVEHDLGAAAAATVVRHLLMGPPRPPAQWPTEPRAGAPCQDQLGELLGWMIENLERPITLELIAARMHLSPRTLLRRFRGSVGMSPHQWLMQQRMVKAKVLLETTDLLVDRVALCCGFRSPGNFRAQFAHACGMSPTQYRSHVPRHSPLVAGHEAP
jgi:AraC family transcriptional activator FtrA